MVTVADTAFSIAAVRAEESSLPEGERLFEDPYAALFAAGGAHAAEATARYLALPLFREGVRVRTRYLDDAVRAGLAAGVRQLVLLGAGFDMRGHRMPELAAADARTWEVDVPAQLERKRALLDVAGVPPSARVAYVPCDFDADACDDALLASLQANGFRVGGGAIFVWEGVIGYIDGDAIDRSLRFMARAGGPGTRVAFTFGDATVAPDPAELRARRAGFRTFEEAPGDDLFRRYLGREPPEHLGVMKLGLAVA
jgi:methyltransferase (TIGR00027 family)